MSVEGNISKKYGVESNITNDDLDYIADKLADMEFQTRLIDALNTASIYRDKAFWNDVVAMIQTKVTAVKGKGLSEADFTAEEKKLLARLEKDYGEIYTEVKSVLGDENSQMGELNLHGLQEAINEAFNRTVQLDRALHNKPSKTELGTSAFVDFTQSITDEPEKGGLIPTVGAVVRYLTNIVLNETNIKVDNYLSLDSENPVQNKAITKAINDTMSEISNKQDKVNITDAHSGGSIGLTNNMEGRAEGTVSNLTIVLDTGDDIPKDYVSYITFKTGDYSSLQFNFFATTQQSYLIKFIGDDCNSNYEFTPQPNKFYEVGFKYVGEMVTEENSGNPTYRHIFVARVGAF